MVAAIVWVSVGKTTECESKFVHRVEVALKLKSFYGEVRSSVDIMLLLRVMIFRL